MNKEREAYDNYLKKVKEIHLETELKMKNAVEWLENQILLIKTENKADCFYLATKKKDYAIKYEALKSNVLNTINSILEGTGYTFNDIFVKSRNRDLVLYRHAIAFIIVRNKIVTKNIYARILNFNHTTIINAIDRVEESLQFPKQNSDQYEIFKMLHTNYLNLPK